MKALTTVFAVTSLLSAAAGGAAAPTAAIAQPAVHTYVACNQYGDCWRVHDVYAYGTSAPITYYNSDWYDQHRTDEHVHWLADNDRGYYDRDAHWHSDPAARAVKGGLTGAGVGAAIGCLVTLPIGCAPGAATGAAVGGGAGAAVGAGTTPPR